MRELISDLIRPARVKTAKAELAGYAHARDMDTEHAFGFDCGA